MSDQILFDKSKAGRRGVTFPMDDLAEHAPSAWLPERFLRKGPLGLPEISENELMRHYISLSLSNYGVDTGIYPLGSCTMKYNPKIHEDIARLHGFDLHPFHPQEMAQGTLEMLYTLGKMLEEIVGMNAISLQPAAGAQAEFVGMLIARAYFLEKGEERTKVIIPDSAHGTNPASATLAGFSIQTVKSNSIGNIDMGDLMKVMDERCAAIMLTNPNTQGLFELEIEKLTTLVHHQGGLVYMDGANLNPLLGLTRPGDMGVDMVHLNLHKTFSTPHGGGGPGAGPIGVSERLSAYLPAPTISKKGDQYVLDSDRPKAIGRVHGFYGNVGILLRAYAYIRRLGSPGLNAISRNTIINANYLKKRMEVSYPATQNRPCMHEFVVSVKGLRGKGIHAWDIAKRLIDYHIYPPTVNFPLIVEEALMIEAVESESRERLDELADTMIAIRREIEEDPSLVITAPHSGGLHRLDEVQATKRLDVCYREPA